MRGVIGIIMALMASAQAAAASAEQRSPGGERRPSPFIQCDGRTGDVDFGEALLRALAATATAGLSEHAMRRDDASGRLSGLAGAEACERALRADAGNALRRVRLGFARTIHYLEAERPEEALRSAQDYPAHIGGRGAEWAIARTLGSAAIMFEAEALLRAGRIAEAEDAAVRASSAAGLEIIGLLRAAQYLNLTPRFADDKKRALELTSQLFPERLMLLADAQAWAGDYRAAAATVGAFIESVRAALPSGDRRLPNLVASQALYAAMAGDMAEARRLASEAQSELEAGLGSGQVVPHQRAITDEHLALVDIIGHAAEGRSGEARRLFSSRSEWLLAPRPVVVAVIATLAAGAEMSERTGLLARDPAQVRDEEFANRANMMRNTDRLSRLYDWTLYQALEADYRGHARRAWRVSPRPYYLVRGMPRTDWPPGSRFEGLSMTNLATGSLADGEALLLHAALIARSRGLSGFAFVPSRVSTTELRVRFGNVGDPGFPTQATVSADPVIEALAPHIPQPQRR
jgi:hypothetical protein